MIEERTTVVARRYLDDVAGGPGEPFGAVSKRLTTDTPNALAEEGLGDRNFGRVSRQRSLCGQSQLRAGGRHSKNVTSYGTGARGALGPHTRAPTEAYRHSTRLPGRRLRGLTRRFPERNAA